MKILSDKWWDVDQHGQRSTEIHATFTSITIVGSMGTTEIAGCPPLALFVCPTDQPCTARCAGLNALSPENMAQLSTFLSQVWSWSAGFTLAVWNAQRTCFSDLSFQFPSCLGSAVPVFCLHFTFSVTYWDMLLNYIGWTCFCRAVATVMGPPDWFRSYMGTRIRNTPPPRKWQALLAKTGYTLVGPSWVPLPD